MQKRQHFAPTMQRSLCAFSPLSSPFPGHLFEMSGRGVMSDREKP